MNFSTSLICCDLSNISEDIDNILKYSEGDSRFSWMHADFMDGHFVPRYGISPELIQHLRKRYGKNIKIDSHLMVDDPYTYMDVIAPYSEWFIFHYEAVSDPVRTLQMLKKKWPEIKTGLAFSLATPIMCETMNQLYENNLIDGIMYMGISPGVLGTNSYFNIVESKLKEIYLTNENIEFFIDGSVNFNTIPEYSKYEPMTCVCGSSSMFKRDKETENMSRAEMIKYNINRIKNLI